MIHNQMFKEIKHLIISLFCFNASKVKSEKGMTKFLRFNYIETYIFRLYF